MASSSPRCALTRRRPARSSSQVSAALSAADRRARRRAAGDCPGTWRPCAAVRSAGRAEAVVGECSGRSRVRLPGAVVPRRAHGSWARRAREVSRVRVRRARSSAFSPRWARRSSSTAAARDALGKVPRSGPAETRPRTPGRARTLTDVDARRRCATLVCRVASRGCATQRCRHSHGLTASDSALGSRLHASCRGSRWIASRFRRDRAGACLRVDLGSAGGRSGADAEGSRASRQHRDRRAAFGDRRRTAAARAGREHHRTE